MEKCKYCNSDEYPLNGDGICTDCARCGVTAATLEEDDQSECDNLTLEQEQLASLKTADYLMVVPHLEAVKTEPYLVRVIGRNADGDIVLEKYSHEQPQWIPATIEQIRPIYCATTEEIALAYLDGKSFTEALNGLRKKTK